MNLAKAREAIKEIALREGIPVEEVRRGIREAVVIGLADPNPMARRFWEEIPRKRKKPSPEEVIAYIAKRIGKRF